MSVRTLVVRVALPLSLLMSLAMQADAPPHVVMISVDGLMPSAYTGQRRRSRRRRLRRWLARAPAPTASSACSRR